MKIKTTLTALALTAAFSLNADAQTFLAETFDDASDFTIGNATPDSNIFFADTFGDFLGLTGGTDDFGADSAPPGLKEYTGFTGSYLTGMDLDGEGAASLFTFTWSGIDISTATDSLEFSGSFAEFFDDPGDIDASDAFFVEAQVDGEGWTTIIEFSPGSFTSTASGGSNGFFELGDITLGNAAQTVTAAIPSSGSDLDIRLTVDLNSGDEDFGVDNFFVTQVPEPSSFALLAGCLALSSVMMRRRSIK